MVGVIGAYRTTLSWLNKSLDFCVKWRYLIALVLFVFCVIFQLHGSSIAEYNNLFDNAAEYNQQSIVVGKSRTIRGDEWAVHTPYYMSQYYNNYDKDSNMMSLDGQDMIVGYNAPVLDISIIAKPFTWGYVLFGNEYGLSWYWCSKMILLFLVSFELCMIVTRKNKKISLLGAVMIAFSPLVQWWFVPHIVDVFFWAMAVFVLAYHFFTAEKWLKNLSNILLPLAVTTFVLALFPSMQIAVGLSILALFVAIMVRDKKEICFSKKDIWRIIFMVLVAGGILGYTLITSKDAIMTLYNTAYPGARVSLGGTDGLKVLFTDLTTFALPFKDITYANNCEVSTFIHFAPIFLMLYPILWKKMKRDRNIIVGNVLLVCIIVMGVFMMIGFPELLAKVTLFSYINRMWMAYGLIATIFTIWGISMIWKKQIFSRKQILITLAIYAFLYLCFVGNNELTYFGWKYYLAVIFGLVVLAYLMLRNHKKLFSVAMFGLIAIAGLTINPVARGIKPLIEHPLEQEIHKIAESDPEAYWLAVDNNYLAPIGIVNGARMLNAVNFYPDFGKWNQIDPEEKDNFVYNRYAHISVSLTDGSTVVRPGVWDDAIEVELSCRDSEKWNVKYLIGSKDLKACGNIFERIYADTEGSYAIYKRKENGK